MGKSKKGLSIRTITVFNPNTDEEFEVYVTYSWYNDDLIDDGESIDITREDIDIKHFESNCDKEIPNWVSEDLVYESLINELESEEINDDDFEDDYDDSYLDDLISDDSDENW